MEASGGVTGTALTDHRYSLLAGRFAQVEDSSASARKPAPSGYSAEHQVVLPYHGFFEYTTGRAAGLVDTNSILYVTGGREFADWHPLPGVGHAAIIITPRPDLLEELCGTAGVSSHPAFLAVTGPSSPSVLLLTHRLLSLRRRGENALAREELTLAAMRASLRSRPTPSSRSRAIQRAKEFLHARGHERISLDDVAQAVGLSPVYLTQEFTRSEGMPLYRYQLRLRLAKALAKLPHCGDITDLALELGFSSHSHFSSVFKATFGISPSEFRRSTAADRAHASDVI